VSDLSGKVVVMTGGASGIGRAAAIALAREGAAIAIGDVDHDRATETAHLIEQEGGRVAVIACDVGRPEQIDRLVADATRAFGAPDIVFGNAGVMAVASLEDLSLEQFERHLAVNLTANFVLAKATVASLRRRGGGSMIFTASVGGLRGSAGSPAYNASKGGLVNLTRSLADELGPDGIRVNCICPGWVETPFNDPFWAHAPAGAKEEITRRIPLRRQASPDEICPVVVFLASDAARYVTGHALIVDGGMLAT
jgi:NAD(P)-dependent dehydrogenase (short-subunit alcohol dehydrogenase family)